MSQREARIDWLPSALRDGVRIGRAGAQVVVEWRGIGRFFGSPSAKTGTFIAAAGTDAAMIDKFKATSLLACRRYLAGNLSLHASAVALPVGAIVLVGDCGAGKSTTAMALVEEQGGKFLADDIVPIDWDACTAVVPPVEDSFWLSGDALTWFGLPAASSEKSACPPRARSANPERLGAIVHLVFDESIQGPRIEPVSGHEAFMVISAAHVCYSVGDDEDSVRHLGARARIARAAKLFRLRRPRSLKALGPAVRLLSERLAVGSGP